MCWWVVIQVLVEQVLNEQVPAERMPAEQVLTVRTARGGLNLIVQCRRPVRHLRGVTFRRSQPTQKKTAPTAHGACPEVALPHLPDRLRP